jgi:hypothetical protein
MYALRSPRITIDTADLPTPTPTAPGGGPFMRPGVWRLSPRLPEIRVTAEPGTNGLRLNALGVNRTDGRNVTFSRFQEVSCETPRCVEVVWSVCCFGTTAYSRSVRVIGQVREDGKVIHVRRVEGVFPAEMSDADITEALGFGSEMGSILTEARSGGTSTTLWVASWIAD